MQSCSFIPPAFRDIALRLFNDSMQPAYGQLATVDPDGMPRVRTVHFRYLPADGTIGFNTHIASPKWDELSAQPRCAGCYFAQAHAIQFRWEGEIELFEVRTGTERSAMVLDAMWRLVRPDVRATYWLDQHGLPPTAPMPQDLDIDRRAPNFGTVIFRPHWWDIFEIDPMDYHRDRRSIHRLEDAAWHSQDVNLLHGGKE